MIRIKKCRHGDPNAISAVVPGTGHGVDNPMVELCFKVQHLVMYDQDSKGRYYHWIDAFIVDEDEPDHFEVLFDD
jgi:hypothetical protein